MMSESEKPNHDSQRASSESKKLTNPSVAFLEQDINDPETPWQPTTADDVLQYMRENLVNSFADASFRESLLFEDVLVGEREAYRLAVAESLWDGKPCFVVEGQSHGITNGVKWKLQLTATVEIPSLGTVRQKRIFTTVEGGSDGEPLDVLECLRTIEMLKRPYTPVEEPPKDGGEGEDEDQPKAIGEGEDAEEPPPIPMHVTYRVTRVLRHHDDREESERVLTEEESGKFFPEGALAILLRCLAKMRFENLAIPLELVNFDSDFELCPFTCMRGDDVKIGESQGLEEEDILRFILGHSYSDGILYRTETHHFVSGAAVYRKQEDPVLLAFRPQHEASIEEGVR